MKLIIAEKPSVAKDIAYAVGATSKKDGYFEGNGYTVTWAIGHLLQMAMPEDYSPELKKWSLGTLPIIPPVFHLKPNPDTQKQLKTISSLLKNKNIEQVVVATDAGREGELIARELIEFSGFKDYNKLYRLWTSEALTKEVVLKCLQNLKPASEFDRLYHAAKARQQADWIVGINLSRAVTCASGNSSLFSVGRVQTAVLALLVDRKRERENFTPIPYWNVSATFSTPTDLKWTGIYIDDKKQTQIFDKKTAQTIADHCKNKPAIVTSVQTKKQRNPPPLLFSLTVLQQEANRLYSMTANDTLAVAQKLYEVRKVISYPRTDSQVLASSNLQLVKDILNKLSPHHQDLIKNINPSLISTSNTRVFNDKKLTDHHAIIPLAPLDAPNASESEIKIYNIILRRFIAAFCDDHTYLSTTVVTTVNSRHNFLSQGKTDINLGWRVVYNFSQQDKNPQLPQLEEDTKSTVIETKLVEKQTEPPPDYTDATLLKDMSDPARYLKDESLRNIFKGEVGLGTQATRAEIIETLIRRDYAERFGKTIRATQKGCFLIDTLRQYPVLSPVTKPDNTAKWEQELEQIAQGKQKHTSFIRKISDFVKEAVSTIVSSQIHYSAPQQQKKHQKKTRHKTTRKGKKIRSVG